MKWVERIFEYCKEMPEIWHVAHEISKIKLSVTAQSSVLIVDLIVDLIVNFWTPTIMFQ